MGFGVMSTAALLEATVIGLPAVVGEPPAIVIDVSVGAYISKMIPSVLPMITAVTVPRYSFCRHQTPKQKRREYFVKKGHQRRRIFPTR